MPDPKGRKAAVLRVNFGTRPEDMILYTSTAWDDLLFNMLSNPVQFFPGQESAWTSTPASWTIKGPITVEMRHATVTIDAAVRATAIVPEDHEEAVAALTLNLENLQTFQDTVQQLLEPGSFLADFAVDTQTLIIHYVPPGQGTLRFNGEIQAPTIAWVKDQIIGNMHFDIKNEVNDSKQVISERRARLILDYLQHPQLVIDRVIQDGVQETDAVLVEPNNPISLLNTSSVDMNDIVFLPLPGGKRSVVIEGVCSTGPCCVCVDVNMARGPGSGGKTNYYMGDVLFKCYACP